MKSNFKVIVSKLELVKKSEFALRFKNNTPIVLRVKDSLLKELSSLVGSEEADIIYKRLGNEKITSILKDYE